MSRIKAPMDRMSSPNERLPCTETPGISNKYATGNPPFSPGLKSESPYWTNSGPTRSTNTDRNASVIAEMRARPTRLTLLKRDMDSPLVTLHFARPLVVDCRPTWTSATDPYRTLSRHCRLLSSPKRTTPMTKAVADAARSPIAYAGHETPPRRGLRYNMKMLSTPHPTAKIVITHSTFPAVIKSGNPGNVMGRKAK
jgi:hypothetical protein